MKDMFKKQYLKIGALLFAFLVMNASYAQQDLKSVLDEILQNNQQLKVAAERNRTIENRINHWFIAC